MLVSLSSLCSSVRFVSSALPELLFLCSIPASAVFASSVFLSVSRVLLLGSRTSNSSFTDILICATLRYFRVVLTHHLTT